MREHSIYLLNTISASTREQITNVDRKVGDCFLKPLGLQYCGYTIVPDTGRLAATWDLPADKINEAIDFAEAHNLDGYSVQVWLGCEKVEVAPSGRHLTPFSRRVA